jgi:hypothetical protein
MAASLPERAAVVLHYQEHGFGRGVDAIVQQLYRAGAGRRMTAAAQGGRRRRSCLPALIQSLHDGHLVEEVDLHKINKKNGSEELGLFFCLAKAACPSLAQPVLPEKTLQLLHTEGSACSFHACQGGTPQRAAGAATLAQQPHPCPPGGSGPQSAWAGPAP